MLIALNACYSGDAEMPVTAYGDCDVQVVSTAPSNGAGDVYHRDPLSFVLTSPDPTAVVLADFPGTQLVSDDGLTITYLPDDPLEPDTTYMVALDYCYAQPEIRFTTSGLGEPLETNLDLLGASWIVNPIGGEYLEGSGFASIMALVFDRDLLVQVIDIDGADLTMRLGVADESGNEQDECFRTVDVTAVDFSEEPYFQYDSSRMSVQSFNGSLTLHDVDLTGTISSDADTFGGIEFSMMVDVADLVSVMKLADVDSLCYMAENLGSDCGPCPEGDSDSCIPVVAHGLVGPMAGLDVVHVEETNTIAGCVAE
jgi:hypothetical protein